MPNNEEKLPEIMTHPEIALELAERARADQKMRTRWTEEKIFLDEDDNFDKESAEWMKKIIAEIGWPTISKVGEIGAHDAWLLVQHADHDVEFQKQCLELMKAEKSGEVWKRDIAYLTDRILVNEKKLQMYGSQFNDDDGVFTPKPIEDGEHVDERRKEMELGTLQEGIAEMYEKYKEEE